MSDILCTFNENGELDALPEYSVEIYFGSEEERDEFQEFMTSGEMGKAFSLWKGGQT